MKDINITMRLYGAFRKYNDSLTFRVRQGSSVAEIKNALGMALGAQAMDLVMDSVIASDKSILPPEFVIEADSSLSALPPVCGG